MTEFEIERKALAYALELKQAESKDMEDKLNAPVVNTIPGFRVLPGVVSKEWIERRNQLQDRSTSYR